MYFTYSFLMFWFSCDHLQLSSEKKNCLHIYLISEAFLSTFLSLLSIFVTYTQNPLFSDHYLITLQTLLLDYTPILKHSYTWCASESTLARFKEQIPSVFNSVPCVYMKENSYTNFSPSQIDHLFDSAAGSLLMTLDSIAPLKKIIIKQRRLAPWYNTQNLKI